MTNLSANRVRSTTLEVPGARLHHEVRGDGPLVVLVGAPMDATSFAPLAKLLAADHTVLTTDPRGINRSQVGDRGQECPPELRADDLARLIGHVDVGPAAVLGSSGGAVSALALAQRTPEAVHTVIAHEPPLDSVLHDRAQLVSATEAMINTYLSGDVRGAWGLFLTKADLHLPDEVFETMFGGERDPQTASDEHHQFANMLRSTTRWQPDLDRLRSGSPRIVIGIGEASAGQFCDRAARALAASLELEPTLFPGGHIGFLEDPMSFAVRLRAVLGAGRVPRDRSATTVAS